jgi:Domain of unknown function (DUF4373)
MAKIKHDLFFRMSAKMQSLVISYGAEVIGIYWSLVEFINENERFDLKKDFNLLSSQINTKEHHLRSIIQNIVSVGLIKIKDDFLYISISKEKKERKDDNTIYTDEQKLSFSKFTKYIETNAPMVSKMEYPFRIKEMIDIKARYSTAFIINMLIKMHNYKPLLKNNVSAYLTFINWAEKDYNKTDKFQQKNISNASKLMNSAT